MEFGKRLKQARITQGLTQEQVANDLMVTHQTISSWENQKTYPDIITLIKISDYFNISLDVLLKEDSDIKVYLEKNEVTKQLRPLTIVLLIIDIIFMGLFVGDTLGIFKLSHEFFLVAMLFGILNAAALVMLSAFQANLGLSRKPLVSVPVFNLFVSKWFLLSGCLLLIAGAIIIMINLAHLGGFIMGIGSLVLFIWLSLTIINRFNH
ncbi:helix-turn-helix domain-containing protein [Furfurilactobacillus siliginis]|uniref:HTH cro/C1-type domain-containing protein n=1 Tax=Furfurilactobacillus siliginis TaxID=348151 RepID=A0A0R2L782_9LACO|nr:helix-turn-helix transcriptional regulator [Furfurilactobacillus siliginis]KRN97313.1 hypothetical protein IV55_GL000241 [Furfurilactobacillus siliginis]GEK28624.1 hypothetical protein LSI01_09350 [Furfurilactobacillus siliginis]